jgi:hypothetical protein
MVFMKPKIGNVYNVDYSHLHDILTFEDATICQIPEENQQQLIDFFHNNAPIIKYRFDESLNKTKEYRRLLRGFEEGKYIFNSREEKKFFKNTLIKMKEELFPRLIVSEPFFKAENLFVRFFSPDRMVINNKSDLKVLYAGKRLTVKGNVVHKWFVLSPSRIRSHYISRDMKKYLKIIDKSM